MKRRIMRGMLALTLGTAAALVLAAALIAYDAFFDRFHAQLKTQLNTAAASMELAQDQTALFKALAVANPSVRFTWIAGDGQVLLDSRTGSRAMENHLMRPEVVQALDGGDGHSERHSTTLGATTIYYARRLADGSVLRLAGTRTSVFALALGFAGLLLLAWLVIASLSAWAAERLTRAVVRPINELNLDDPLSSDQPYAELSPLIARLDQSNRRAAAQMRELAARQNQLSAITSGMEEGLVVLDARQYVLMLNRSAARLFGVDPQAQIGRHVLTLGRDMALLSAVRTAMEGASATEHLALNGRQYQLLASPVMEDGTRAGALLLLLDVTDKQLAEQSRRTFSANVSHELKTPLTSILGYAELMSGGLAGEGDMRAFAGRIHEEAAQLLTLIDDIIHLSRLDERPAARADELVELSALCKAAAARLAPAAEKAGVTIEAGGEAASVRGERTLLEELVFNLADNAVKYNVPGGSVRLSVRTGPEGVSLTVDDTGIGIPEDEQGRVFERFYRVDKSRSKEVPGTGLGLSIAKHAAQLCGGTIALQSVLGKGTQVRVEFPA